MSVDIGIEEGIATIILNRPRALNSIDMATTLRLQEVWSEIDNNNDIRVAIITGAGERAFCVGSDLKEGSQDTRGAASRAFGNDRTPHPHRGLEDVTKPLICAINGYALGGGLELALSCDIRIASNNAQFGLTEVKLGSMPGVGGSQRLPRIVGLSNAMLMLLTGDIIDATEALRIGLVSRVVDQRALLSQARDIAQRIARNAPLSIAATKRAAYSGLDVPLRTGLQIERDAFELVKDSEDRLEGRKAFREKRSPAYRGC